MAARAKLRATADRKEKKRARPSRTRWPSLDFAAAWLDRLRHRLMYRAAQYRPIDRRRHIDAADAANLDIDALLQDSLDRDGRQLPRANIKRRHAIDYADYIIT